MKLAVLYAIILNIVMILKLMILMWSYGVMDLKKKVK